MCWPRVNKHVDGLNEKMTSVGEKEKNIECVDDSANKAMSVLVDKVGECKESVGLVIDTLDECVKKVDGYETVAGIYAINM